jgi:hypothetical protein
MTGTNADGEAATSSLLAGVCACRCSRTHLRNWLAFTPAFNARPDNDAPGCWQASTNCRLPRGSKLRLPHSPTYGIARRTSHEPHALAGALYRASGFVLRPKPVTRVHLTE